MPNAYKELPVSANRMGCRVFDFKPHHPPEDPFLSHDRDANVRETCELYWSEIKQLAKVLEIDPELPFGPLCNWSSQIGLFINQIGQSALGRSIVQWTDQSFQPPDSVAHLWRATRKIRGTPERNDQCAALRGLEELDGRLVLTVGPGSFHDGWTTNDALGLRHQESGLSFRRLLDQQCNGRLPSFESGVSENLVGMANVVVTADGYLALTRRGNSVSVNRGINSSVTSRIDWQLPMLGCYSLAQMIGHQIDVEAFEEGGFRVPRLWCGGEFIELADNSSSAAYSVILGAARELPRCGTPEFFGAIMWPGTLAELVSAWANNQHRGREETDRYIYGVPVNRIKELAAGELTDLTIHFKARLNIILLLHAWQSGIIKPP